MCMQPQRKQSSGFTLIEILIVIAIIGVMYSSSFNPITQLTKARDAKRKDDINSFRIALEDYYNDKGCYPTMEQWNQATCGSPVSFLHVKSFACDPINHKKYVYQTTQENGEPCDGVCGACQGYRLLTKLENVADPAIEKVGCDAIGCGVIPETGYCPNWGVAMGAPVPLPGFVPGIHECKTSEPPT